MSVTAKDMVERLRRHYIKPGPMPGGIFLPECGLNGSTGNRVDAVYIGFTSTSGRHLIGHEIKVSRSDWRHELDQPGKADLWADQCHAWYAVAPSTDIIVPEELPEGWGLLVINPRTKTRLDTVVKATVHSERTPSWLVVRSIMARLDTLQASEIQDIRATAHQAARAEVAEEARKAAKRELESQHSKDTEALRLFTEVFGMELAPWMERGDRVTPERLKEALELLEAHPSIAGRYDGLNGAIGSLEQALERLSRLRAAIETYDGTPSLDLAVG